MSSPRTDTTDTETSEKPRSSALSPVQIAAGALAAVSSAVVMSFFGVAGTLIGAALASIISSISAALYTESLRKTNERLRQVRHLRSGFTPAAPGADAAQAATSVLPAHLDPRRAPAPVRRPRWVRLTGYAVAVFVLAMGIVTGIEVIGQQPVSALVGTSTSTETTTLGSLTNASSSRDAPSTPGTPSQSSPAGETSDRSDAPGTGTGTPDGTTAPTTSTAPRSTAEAEPTTEAPQTSQQSPTARTTP